MGEKEENYLVLEGFYGTINNGLMSTEKGDRDFAASWLKNHREKLEKDAKGGILSAKFLLEDIKKYPLW